MNLVVGRLMPSPRRRVALVIDAVVVAGLLVVSFGFGRFAFRHDPTPPDYYYLAPAVMVAAGQGLVSPLPAPETPLARFLAGEVPTVAVADVASVAVGPPDPFHNATRYLLYALGYWWRAAGISWDGVADFAAMLHAFAVLAVYAGTRVFLAVPWSLAAAAFIATSTLQLALVPHVRDYSKAAFILGALPFVLAMAFRSASTPALLASAAAAGLTIGVGIGFRMDVGIMMPLAFAAVVLFREARPWHDLPRKLLACAVLTVGLWLPAWPVIAQLSSGGSNESHVVILGFADVFEVGLGIARADYSLLPFYSDTYVGAEVTAYGTAAGGRPMEVPSPEYSRASRDLWLRMLASFPADVWTRMVGAADAVMNLPFRQPFAAFTEPLPGHTPIGFAHAWLARLNGGGALLGYALLALAAAHSLRCLAFTALLLLVLAGYPSMQFSDRHYFHLQAIPVFAMVALVATLAGLRRGRLANRGVWLRPLVVAVAAVILLTVLPMALLRWYQAPRVAALLQEYVSGARVPVAVEVVPDAQDSWLVRWPAPPAAMGHAHAAQYALDFESDVSGEPIIAGLRFSAAVPGDDFSRVLVLNPSAGINTVGFTALTVNGRTAFDGVELGARAARRLRGVYYLPAPIRPRLPLDVTLPADWALRRHYQRLRVGGVPDAPGLDTVVCASAPGCTGLIGYLDRLAGVPPLAADTVTVFDAAVVSAADGRVSARGMADNASSYLFQLPPRTLTGPGVFVARGEMAGGGAVVGLLRRQVWYQQAFLTNPGRFVAVVPVVEAGEFTPLITNALPRGRRRQQIVVTNAGFIEATP